MRGNIARRLTADWEILWIPSGQLPRATSPGGFFMKTFLLIYAAVIFIIAVLLFTYSELKKDAENLEEPETYHWIKVFSVLLLIMAIASFIASRMTPA